MGLKQTISTRRRGILTGGAVLGVIGALAVSLAPSADATTAASRAKPVTLGNGSVILDSGKNFTEPDGSEGTAGPGCRDLAQPGLASSVVLTGGPIMLFTGHRCTGRSAVITASVADLSRIEFDKKIVSIQFGR
jgi:hypothetical protein